MKAMEDGRCPVPLFLGRHRGRPSKQPGDLRVRESQDPRFLRAVIEGAKGADLLEPAHRVSVSEEFGVARGQLGRLEITAAQIRRLERTGISAAKRWSSQRRSCARPFASSGRKRRTTAARDTCPRAPGLEVPREILRRDLALALFELQRGMERMVDSSTNAINDRMLRSLNPARGSCRSSVRFSQRE